MFLSNSKYKGREKIKAIIRLSIVFIFVFYLVAVIMKSDFWGNILSPVTTLAFFCIIFEAFFLKQKTLVNRLSGLCISLSILIWGICDIAWAVEDMILGIDPQNNLVITLGYASVNLFLALALSIYGFHALRKWNILQVILDSVVMAYFIISLTWIVFFDENMRNFMMLRSDWISTVSIILNVLTILWIAIWFISIRSGKLPIYFRMVAAGVFLYCNTDIVFFYEYFYKTYDPNSLLDAMYMMSFAMICFAAILRKKSDGFDSATIAYNTGRRGKGYLLFLAPITLIIFKGFLFTVLIHYAVAIILYYMISSYVQNNIYKEGLLRKEKEQNGILEQRVKERTEELEQNNIVLQQLIHQDYVTGLYNRRYLLRYLEEETAKLKEEETIVLLYIDINRYKMITTMYGTEIGEKILYQMALKLRQIEKITKNSILSSYGNDAFIYAATGPYDYKDGYAFAEKAVSLCSSIYHIDELMIRITVNVGISLYPYDAITIKDLIKHSDIAMTQARSHGFNMIQEFDLKLSDIFFRKNSIELMLKKADFRQEFMIYYQPQLLTNNRKLIGFEALLRWKTSSGDFISPAEFIPVAEETGYIIPIGVWVIKTAIKQIVDWNNRFEEKIMVGINISLKQLNSARFVDQLKEELERMKVKPEWIDLEITESLQLQENPEVIDILNKIRKLGIMISIDDFGTGFSSLSYFKGLPTDRIKLAKELIDYIHTDEFDYHLVKSIIQLSKAKGIRVIAEGVETKEQWETLKELGCDEVQGYYFGRPMPVQQVEEIFEEELMRNSRQNEILSKLG